MERTWFLHTQKGLLKISETDAIQNALEQEKNGIKPHYSFTDKNGAPCLNPGWLVWSTWTDGAGVVYRRDDGKMIIITGWQGEFCFV